MNFSNLFRTEQAHPTNNMDNRKNCAVIDFSVIPTKPKPSRVHEFITSKVKLNWSQVKGLQLNNVMSRVFLKMDSPEAVEQLVEANNMKHTIEFKGTTYEIPFFVADGAVDVKLHDLPFDMANVTIVEHMRAYGEVLSIKNDTWQTLFKGLPNGVRILRMRITKPVPSYVVVAGEMTLCTHKNQIPTCRHCGRRVHYTMKCSEYAKSLLVTTQTQSTVNNPTPTESAHQTGEMSDQTKSISPNPSRSSSVSCITNAAVDAVAAAAAVPVPIFSAASAPANTMSAATIVTATENNPTIVEVVGLDSTNANSLLPNRHTTKYVVLRNANDMDIATEISDTDDEINPTPPSLVEEDHRKISPVGKARNTPQENFKRPGSPGTKNNDNKRRSRSRNRH